MNNIVFFFTGTGNCLKVAKDISKELGNCEIASMGNSGKPFDAAKQYDSIGFVYPTYFFGLPKKVIEFVQSLNFENNKNAYFYSITTYGGTAGNAIYQLYELLFKKHGIKLNYGTKLKMFSNYIVMYEMSKNVDAITKKSNKKLIPIINSIKTKRNNRVNKLTKIFAFLNTNFLKRVSDMDKDYIVADNCNGCEICEKVCPVRNIEIVNNKPQFKHTCENCVACIQFCPQKAINYKNATQNRRRYTHPEISYTELVGYNR